MQRVDSLEKTLMLGGIGGRREGDDRGCDGWMASPTQWTWVWVNSGSWWWTGRPGVLRFMGSQRVKHDWATELNWLNWTEKSSWGKALQILKKNNHTWSQTGPAKPLKALGQFCFYWSILPVGLRRYTQRLIWVWKQITNWRRGLNDCQ